MQIDDMLDQAGGIGAFQIIAFAIITCGISGIHFLWYGLPLFIKHPVYACQLTDPSLDMNSMCTAEQICAGNPNILSWHIDWESHESINNWQQKFDMMCEPKFKIGMIGSSFFIGWCFSLLWIPRLADIYGRVILFRIAQVFDFILFTAFFLTNNLNVAIGIIFCIGFTTSIRLAAGYIFMLEFFPKRS